MTRWWQRRWPDMDTNVQFIALQDAARFGGRRGILYERPVQCHRRSGTAAEGSSAGGRHTADSTSEIAF